MIVRIQLGAGRRVQRKAGPGKVGKNRSLALACGALLIPAALVAYVLGFWRLASDMGLAGDSGITGVFSHWQILMAVAVLLHAASSILNRYGRHGEFHLPHLLKLKLLPRAPEDKPAEPLFTRMPR